MTTSEGIFEKYSKCGLLTRNNDGQSPITLKELKATIGKIVIDKNKISENTDRVLNLGGLLPNNAPTYSASLLSNHKYNVLWYYFKISDPFQKNTLPEIGNRTTLVAVLKPSNIFVAGLCLWDADSNDRNSELIPNNPNDNRATSQNDFSMRRIFDGIGNYQYDGPKSLNNFSWYNPLIRPYTDTSIAKTEKEICDFLQEAGDLKEFWVSHLKQEANGFNTECGRYITETYGSGVESEVLISPIYDKDRTIYGELKFSIDDIAAMAFITDGLMHDSHTLMEYEKAVEEFFKEGTGGKGWIHPATVSQVNGIPIINIIRVALPNVQMDSTSSTMVGEAWMEYLIKGDTYQSPLTSDDFKTIRERIKG